MMLTDYVKTYEQILPPSVCEAIINKFDVDKRVVDGKVNTENGPSNTEVRSCLELNISQLDDWSELQGHLFRFAQAGIRKYMSDARGVMFPPSWGYEEFRIKKYRPEQKDHFATHADVQDYTSARRFLVAFFYLNDVVVGGETVFPHPHVYVPPRQGRMLIFPPFWLYPHTGMPPVSNAKYIVGTYLHYKDSL